MYKRFLKCLAVVALVLGVTIAPAYSIDLSCSESATEQAGEAITANQFVYRKATDGKVYIADADGSSTYPSVGMAIKAISSGGYGAVCWEGLVQSDSSLTTGSPIYLSTTAGSYTQTATAYGQTVGVAESATKWRIKVDPGYSPVVKGTTADFSSAATVGSTLSVTGTATVGALTSSGAISGTTVTGSGALSATTGDFSGDLTAAGGWFMPVAMTSTNIQDGLAAVALTINANQTNTEYVMPWAGSVVGISIGSNEARTAGTLTVDATVNGTVTGLQAVLDATNTTYHYASQAKDTDTFTAGQRIGVKITTSSWTPTTADIVVTVFVESGNS